MIPLDEALAAATAEARPLPVETLPVSGTPGRVLARPVVAAVDLPRFDQSALDGYAFRADDTVGASPATPVRLTIARRIAAGAHATLPPLHPGHCARIFTGAPLPPGADAVVAQERARTDGDALVLDARWTAWRNVRRRGEEQRAGDAVAATGTRITPGLLAALINAGAAALAVTRRPCVRVLTTGDEVRPIGSTMATGEIPDSNGPLIGAFLRTHGVPALSIEHVRDEVQAVRTAIDAALGDADLVITAGGASVGEHDYIVASADSLGLRRVFWTIAQKPGKPMLLAVRESPRRALLLGLPGNPGAVLACLTVHGRRIIDVLQGIADPGPHWAMGRLTDEVKRDPERTRLLRMRLVHDRDGLTQLHPLPHQDSHMLGNLDRADVLVRVDAGRGVAAAGSVLPWTALPG